MSKKTNALFFLYFLTKHRKEIFTFNYAYATFCFFHQPAKETDTKIYVQRFWKERLTRPLHRDVLYFDGLCSLVFFGYVSLYFGIARFLYWLFDGNLFGVIGLVDIFRLRKFKREMFPEMKEEIIEVLKLDNFPPTRKITRAEFKEMGTWDLVLQREAICEVREQSDDNKISRKREAKRFKFIGKKLKNLDDLIKYAKKIGLTNTIKCFESSGTVLVRIPREEAQPKFKEIPFNMTGLKKSPNDRIDPMVNLEDPFEYYEVIGPLDISDIEGPLDDYELDELIVRAHSTNLEDLEHLDELFDYYAFLGPLDYKNRLDFGKDDDPLN